MASKLNRIIVFSAGLSSSVVAMKAFDYLKIQDDNGGHDRPSFLLVTPLLETLNAKMSSLKHYTHEDALRLQQVQIITRHGARTPFKFIPNTEPATWRESDNVDLPHTLINFCVRTADGGGQPQSAIDNAYLKKERLNGGSLVGQLTNVGQQQMFDLGRRLKSKYVDQLGFLSPEFNHEEIFVRTTNIMRTVKSARCILAGLYGGTTLKSPITMITSVNEHEFMYPNYYFCKSLKHWAEIAWSTSAEVPGLTEYYAMLAKRFGIQENAEELSVVGLHDNIRARIAHGHPVPKFLMEQISDIERLAVLVQLRVIAGTGKSPNIIRNAVGNFLENICTQMEDKMHNQSKYKMLLYSSHDTTLMALLKVLGVYDNKWPKFAADVKIELYKQSAEKWFVKVIYNDKEMRLPGCDSTLCPTERFLALMDKYRVKDWDADCGVKGDYKKETFAIGTI